MGTSTRATAMRAARSLPSPAVRLARRAVSRRTVSIRSKADELSDVLADAIDEAKEDCAVAWDNVEEISAEISHKKAAKKTDPLEDFCDDNPEADECRVYED